jgi:hypothetical protein
MDEQVTVVAGIVIPSGSPVFLSIVALHISVALLGVIFGLIAMLSPKRMGRHTRYGKVYFWSLVGFLGPRACSPSCAGQRTILLLIAFYVDNGKNLPLWRDLPPVSYWVIPAAIGVPLIVRTLLRHPLTRPERTGTGQNPSAKHTITDERDEPDAA